MSDALETTRDATTPSPHVAPYEDWPEDDVIDLSQILTTLTEQKWVIAGFVAACFIAAAAYVFTATPLYRATLILRPGSIANKAQWKVEDIKKWFDENNYASIFPRELLGPKESLPKIRAMLTRGSNFVTAELLYPDKDKGTAILSALYDNFQKFYVEEGRDPAVIAEKMALQKQIDDMVFQLETIDAVQLPSLNLEIRQKMQSADILRKNLEAILAQRERDMKSIKVFQDALAVVQANASKLMEETSRILKGPQRGNLETMLFTNVLQQNIAYASELQSRISDLERAVTQSRVEESTLQQRISTLLSEIEKLKIQTGEEQRLQKIQLERSIEQTKEKLRLLTPVEKISDPTASPKPVRPQKTQTLALASVLGLFLGIFAAFVRHSLQKGRRPTDGSA